MKLPDPDYRSDIDGLRAFAVIAVILYHADISLAGTQLLPGGFIGVDMFFVISGYLIMRKITQLSEGKGNWLLSFAKGRFRRIFPALVAMLLVTYVPAFFLMWPSEFAKFSKSALSALFSVSNVFYYFQDPYEAAKNAFEPLIHTWTLGVEAQFYLIFPLLVLPFLYSGARCSLWQAVAAMTVASFAAAEATSYIDRSAAFYLLPTRLWEFGLGAVVAVYPRPYRMIRYPHLLPVLLMTVILVSLILFRHDIHHPGLVTLLPAGSVAALIWYGKYERNTPVFRFLSFRPLMFVGLISYSLYIWHQPIFSFARIYYSDEPPISIKLLAILGTLIISYFSWRYIEETFRGRRTVPRPLAVSFISAVAIVLTLGGTIWGSATGYSYPHYIVSDLIYEPKRGLATRNGVPCPINTLEDICIIGSSEEEPATALLGDSHAMTISGEIGAMLARRNQSALLLALNGCPFIQGVQRYEYPRDCGGHVEAVFKILFDRNIKSVIISDYRSAYLMGSADQNRDVSRKLAVYSAEAGKESSTRVSDILELQSATFERLLSSGITVYYLAPVPDSPISVPNAIRHRAADGRLPFTFHLDAYLQRNQILLKEIETFSARNAFHVIYPHETFCNSLTRRCRTHSDQRIFYTDSNHLSDDGAKILVKDLERLIFNN